MDNTINIRGVSISDNKSIADIYNYYVKNTCSTFVTDEVDASTILSQIELITTRNFPYYVATTSDGKVVGFCYCHTWNTKQAYNSTCELTIYIHSEYKKQGIGKKLMNYILCNINRKRFHSIISIITLPNIGSVKLHEAFGFKQVSFMPQVGWKHNDWRDVGHWQLIL